MRSWSIACRSLARRPAFTTTAILTLAFGVAVTTTMFSVVDTVVVKPLPFPHADRLVTVMEASPTGTRKTSLVAPIRLEDWNAAARGFETISGWYSENVTDTSGDEPERLEGRRVAPRFFAVYGMSPLVGRTFQPDEERFGGPRAAVISEGLWTRRYARDPAVLSRRLILAGSSYAIVGVMPRAFTGGSIDIWIPAQLAPGLLRVREARFLGGVGRMKPGVTIEQATADLVNVQEALGERYPGTDKGWSVLVGDMKANRVGDYQRALWLAFAAVAVLLAIAVANIAGLVLVQLHRRARELAVRHAMGGSRRQIVAAVMQEVSIVAALGSAIGAAAALALVRLFATTFTSVPRMNELTLDVRGLSFAVGASGVAALAFGLWPALAATHRDLAPALAEGGRGASAARHRMQRLLVLSQIALSVVLLASAGLVLKSYDNLSRVDPGFDPARTMTFHVGAAWDENRVRIGQLQEQLVAELERMPGVTAAGMASFLPATGATLRSQGTLEGLATTEDNGRMTVGYRVIGGGYLKALGAPLLAGEWCPPLQRDFNAPMRTLVNRAFADRAGVDPVGRHFKLEMGNASFEIVGVVGDVVEDGPGAAAAPYVYACMVAGGWPDPEYVVRSNGDPLALAATVRAIVHRLDATRAVFGMKPLDAVLAASLDRPRLNAGMLSLFATAALTLASIGLYSLLTLLVSERTREMGVRMALGAAPREVAWLVLAGAGRLLAGGIVVGLVLTAAVAQLLRALLFGVSPMDGRTLAGAVLVLAGVALAAAAMPARRAATLDPIEAIRRD